VNEDDSADFVILVTQQNATVEGSLLAGGKRRVVDEALQVRLDQLTSGIRISFPSKTIRDPQNSAGT
jgi:hypothetical protein